MSKKKNHLLFASATNFDWYVSDPPSTIKILKVGHCIGESTKNDLTSLLNIAIIGLKNCLTYYKTNDSLIALKLSLFQAISKASKILTL